MPGPSAPVTEIQDLLTASSGTSQVASEAAAAPCPAPSPDSLEQLERGSTKSENAGELADFIGGPRLAFRLLAENINEVFWIGDSLRSQIFYCSPAYQPIW